MKIKKFGELNELSKELIDRTSDAMFSRGQKTRAKKLVNTYNEANYDFKSFIGKPLFKNEYILNIKIDKEDHSGKEYDVILIYYSNNQEFNRSHGTTSYYINEDKWVGLPHKHEVTRQDARLLGKIAAIVNPDTKYLKGPGDIQIGEY